MSREVIAKGFMKCYGDVNVTNLMMILSPRGIEIPENILNDINKYVDDGDRDSYDNIVDHFDKITNFDKRSRYKSILLEIQDSLYIADYTEESEAWLMVPTGPEGNGTYEFVTAFDNGGSFLDHELEEMFNNI